MIKFNLNKSTLKKCSAFEDDDEDNEKKLFKPKVSFGNLKTTVSSVDVDQEDKEIANVMGFGMFGRPPKEESKHVKPSTMKVNNIQSKKTARKFDVQEIMKEHQVKWSSALKESSEENSEDEDSRHDVETKNQSEVEDEEDDDLIGPPLPPGFHVDLSDGISSGETSKTTKTNYDDDDDDNDADYNDEDDGN